mmetsp:Transcript_52615/g.87364  ORF Transcript_52615/g.87364 Transcript_52615/m.87364 type:complete len:94 (+) Transcript_52615:688-969(+)
MTATRSESPSTDATRNCELNVNCRVGGHPGPNASEERCSSADGSDRLMVAVQTFLLVELPSLVISSRTPSQNRHSEQRKARSSKRSSEWCVRA